MKDNIEFNKFYYDEIVNPITIGNAVLTWKNGKELS